MLKRLIDNALIEWKKREGHHPLVVSGLRQIGKTTSVRFFGEQNYKHVVYLDLRSNKSIHSVFDGDFSVDEMVLAITANDPDAVFEPYNTLIIMDEIQDCPNARSSLKYWSMDGRYDVVATGSFLGVKGFRKPYTRGIPVGYEDRITMYPLTFEEFLDNIGVQENVVDYVRKCVDEIKPVMQTIHDSMMNYYLQYLVVGGMPEAVNTFFSTHDLNQVRSVQIGIIESIKDDFGRYFNAKGEEKINEVLKLRAEACLNSLPAQLAKNYKKFQYSLVDVRGHSPEKADGLQYLLDLGLVYKSFNIREISTPLEANKVDTEFKVFMADTGLLISMLEQGTAAKVLTGDLSYYKGAIAENMVAVTFMADNMPLYYYRASNGSPELDFIYSDNGEAVIVECKSGNNRATSMKYVLSHPNKYGKHRGIKIANANVGNSDKYSTYPLYTLYLLLKTARHLLITVDDPTELSRLLQKQDDGK